MKVERIISKNATFQKFEVLKANRNKRHRYQEFFVEGVRNINEAVRNGWRIHSFLYCFEKPLSDWAKHILSHTACVRNVELTRDLITDLSSKEDTSELMAVVGMREAGNDREDRSKDPIFVLFDRPSNKGNLGTLMRSCDAFGVEELIITGHGVDPYDPDVIASSMGSFFRLPFRRLSSNTEIDMFFTGLRERYPDLRIFGTTAHQRTSLYEEDLTGPVLFLIGNETLGLNNHLLQGSDALVTIPMHKDSSASSFNVSCAATVMLYEAIRQRAEG